jgi:hypothetical protein
MTRISVIEGKKKNGNRGTPEMCSLDGLEIFFVVDLTVEEQVQ